MVMPYWESPDMLKEQVRHWLDWRMVPRRRTTFVIVDDCSAEHPIDIDYLRDVSLDIRVFRIARKVVWNWRAAKNIGMHWAPGGWSLITDIDHVLPRDEAAALFNTPLNPDCAYHFKRRTASDGKPYRVHSSTWLMTRKRFWMVGGYDESFAGTQMGWIGEYPGRVRATVAAIETLPVTMLRYDSSVIADSTAKLPRGEARYRDEVERIKATWKGPVSMTFPYERLL